MPIRPPGPPRKRLKCAADRLQGKLFLQALLWISGKTKGQLAWDYASVGSDGVKSSPNRQFHRWANGDQPSHKWVTRLEQDFPGVGKWRTSTLIEITHSRWRLRAVTIHSRSRHHLMGFERSFEAREQLRSLIENPKTLDAWLDRLEPYEQGEMLARILVSLLSIRGPAAYHARAPRHEIRCHIDSFHQAIARVLCRPPYAALASDIAAGLLTHLEADESPERIRLPRARGGPLRAASIGTGAEQASGHIVR